jgi:hypothetical protein
MIKQGVVDPVFEEYIASKCARWINLKYQVTPQNTRYDFSLNDDEDIRVLGEIKSRTKWFPDWFVEDVKSEWLLEACKLFKCTPWYIIHCLPNQTTYQINLYHKFPFRRGAMNGKPGIFVDLEHWEIVKDRKSSLTRMSPLDWK